MLSRTAENLYWMSRYMERAESLARILDAAYRLSSLPTAYGGGLTEWESAIKTAGCEEDFLAAHGEVTSEAVIHYLAFSRESPASIRNCLERARHNARAERTALTSEMWAAINGTYLEMHEIEAAGDTQRFISFVKEASLRFDGTAYRTMLRNDAFWFTQLGLFIERADNTARILDVKYHVLLPKHAEVGGGLDYYQWASILRSVSALTSYRWVYRDSVKPWLVADLLVLKEDMPRSLASCYSNITTYLDRLSMAYGRQGPSQKLARTLYGKLRNGRIEAVFQSGLHEFIEEFIAANDQLGAAISEQYLS
ncbi:alpha-E domain-containing protein [Chelatococcus reniformis]|uniref:alpha-E domain-containing protein n=1 Tax=Chelatococcus reniformis TaxID=1494448 RepID=UPI00166B1083|nr:alpha-E domain-containing protein [Chelatococcus reniformis]